jgi:hypothetical protein
MDYGYTLVGFIGTVRTIPNTANPFFLPNHEDAMHNPTLTLMQYIEEVKMYGAISGIGGSVWVNLPFLYKLKWVHGKIDFYDLCHGGHYKLLDEKYKNPFENQPLANIPLEDKSKMYNWLNDGVIGKSRKDIIIEIEQKYPGLFKPIFINPSVPKLFSPKTPSNSPPPIKEIIAPQIIVSNKSKKKQSKPPRDVALTKKYRNQRSKQTFPDWWEVKSE